METSGEALILCGKAVGMCHKEMVAYVQKNKKEFKPETIPRHRGTDQSENSWANQLADIYLSQIYKLLKVKEFPNPPRAMMDYFVTKDGNQAFWNNNPLSKNILETIMCRNMDNAKIIDCYKRGIFSEYSKEAMKKMLYERSILGKKNEGK